MRRLGIVPATIAAILAAAACAGTASSPTVPAASPTAVAASAAIAGGLTVEGAWARPGQTGGISAAYLTVTNASSADDALLSASSPAAGTVEVHETTTDASGMTGMQTVERVTVPAGGSVDFKPGGHHLMLLELTDAYTQGETIDLALVFEKAGTVNVVAEVRPD
jgi:copper(I)-binding protein